MGTYDAKHVKNIALLGHAGSGKTTLAETMLFEAGLINKRGSVEEHNTVSDFHALEKERENSVFSTLLHTEWRGYKINIIDAPGFDDFIGEIIAALRVADTAVILLNAQHGVEVGTEVIWENVEKFQKPAIFAINQLDHGKADFNQTYEMAKERFGNKLTLVQYPLNPGPEFDTIVDVLKMTAYKFPPEGGKPEKIPIPDDEQERAKQLHIELVESIAENDEDLMEMYFEKGSLDEDEMRKGLKLSMIKQELFPLFCLSAKKNMGSGRLMGFIDNVAPSGVEMEGDTLVNGEKLSCDPSGPACAFVFKTVSEQHLGDMTFFRVASGTLTPGIELENSSTSTTEKLAQLYIVKGKEREPVEKLEAGDLGATVKLKATHTNNTLHIKGQKLQLEPLVFPDPVIRKTIVSNKKGEEDKLAMALHKLQEEDPTIIVEHSEELKETILHGQGEMHLTVAKWKLENVFGLDIDYREPGIPYRETIRKKVTTNYRHKKQSGGAGQFAEIYMQVEPWYEGMPDPKDYNVRGKEEIDLPWGGKLVFLNCIVGGVIDQRFMPSILKGIKEKMQDGPLTGSCARDVRVSVYDGKMHPVDSNDMAFKTAAMMAFKEAFLQAKPQVLEPVYKINVLTPANLTGDVMSDLQTRRAEIENIDGEGFYQHIHAIIPLAEMNGFASALRSISQGRARFSAEFHEYRNVPSEVQEKLVNKELV